MYVYGYVYIFLIPHLLAHLPHDRLRAFDDSVDELSLSSLRILIRGCV